MKLKTIPYFLLSQFISPFYKLPQILNDEQTIEYIKNNKCSISRFGDGELNLMMGFDIPFQIKNKELQKKLKEVKTTKKCLACIPNIFNKEFKEGVTENEFNFWNSNKKKFLGLWKKYFGKNFLLGDSFISRFYLRKKDKTSTNRYVNKLKEIWQQKDIIFVEGENSRLGYGNDLFDNAKSIRRILCPSYNAFNKYYQILDAIKNYAQKESLIILALGPTATVLAYDLSECGYQALDLGHIDIEYEWFKMGATEKCPVKNKHVNECKSSGETNLSKLDKAYISQIIHKV